MTVELPSLSDNIKHTDKRVPEIGKIIKNLLPENGLILVVGLGNKRITPDALGPLAAGFRYDIRYYGTLCVPTSAGGVHP